MRDLRVVALMVALHLPACGGGGPGTPPESAAIGYPTFMSPHSKPIAVSGGLVFVVNTPADTVDVIDTDTRAIISRIHVGIDPGGMAIRPDGKEVWVTNHISDSVSVIDSDPASVTHLQVIATIQEFDAAAATRFDEPVGVALASNKKAYVALSTENEIAVIDVVARKVVKRLEITAQDPRAITVRGNRLYVIPFESNNRTQVSGTTGALESPFTFDVTAHRDDKVKFVHSLGQDIDIIKHPDMPDRDLFVFDTTTDQLVEVIDTLGTLLSGLTVDSKGRVFIAQTDARNDANGKAGTAGHGLAELENRAFLNRITRVDPGQTPQFIDLEPLPPLHPAPGMALATPFAIKISDDDSLLVVSAAGSDMLFTVDANSGAVLGRVAVGAVPRGIALEANRAWILNAVANTVSLVDLSNPFDPRILTTIALEDPTHPDVKAGRIAFHDADASTTRTFSCESCHPDGHSDQLLWVLDTPVVEGSAQINPRTAMPVRGLRDTAPYHWDGIPGDPYGGNNGANIHGDLPPTADIDVPESSTRALVDGGLATTMKTVGDPTTNDEGKSGALNAAERDALSIFLLAVPYPPSKERPYTNVPTDTAKLGFEMFHVIELLEEREQACGDCHRMPFWTSTNDQRHGMDSTTWRGAYDRFALGSHGKRLVFDLIPQAERDQGFPEKEQWIADDEGPLWNMVTEGSTGFSGSFARQVTLSPSTANAVLTHELLDALELSASEGGIVLQAEGVFIDGATATPVALHFGNGAYFERIDEPRSFTRARLVSLAAQGNFLGTFTARLGQYVNVDYPQPAIWTRGPIHTQYLEGQNFPVLAGPNHSMFISGRHIREDARIIVDGRRVIGAIELQPATHSSAAASDRDVIVILDVLPPDGLHLLQIQNKDGLFSNDYIFYTGEGPERR